jgi:hypothetical protein
LLKCFDTIDNLLLLFHAPLVLKQAHPDELAGDRGRVRLKVALDDLLGKTFE